MYKQVSGERAHILSQRILDIPETLYQRRSLEASLHFFHSPGQKIKFSQAEGVSPSALSRFFNVYDWDSDRCWDEMQDIHWRILLDVAHSKRRPRLRLSVDLTTVEKVGTQLPYVSVYNGRHGIHLVVLFAEYGELKFPISYRVYQGKHTSTPVTLALDLLEEVPDFIKKRFRVRVLADSGFEAAVFLEGVRHLDFEFVVGVRSNRRTDHPGRVTVADCPHGGYVNLANWSLETLSLGRVDRGDREFFAVSSELLEGDEIIAEGGRRWTLESFFKEGKHQFGLAQFALRTARGLDRWILMVFLAFTLTILHRSEGMTLKEAARLALYTLFPVVRLNHLLSQLQKEREFLLQHGYSLSYARCKL
ncbi:transposase [Deinococcus radiophilus]|uniref:transposase n=1 Tax=Deinococcus radiophilus TaxID=32062 RepID=UPI001E371C89|nr:transposase [Deinococcus radiophilus]UFA51566.1 transposase [Deinococcus radiophilus]